MEQNPKERDLQMFEGQLKSWAAWYSYFEDISKEDPNIIFTKPGEYLTDYLDINTGEPTEKMLQGLEDGQRRVKGL